MILGQLVQTGRRYCEFRPAEFIPDTNRSHTLIAYCANERFRNETFFGVDMPLEEDINEWLKEVGAIACVSISRVSNPLQYEFPTPVGRNLANILTLAASTQTAQLRASFEVTRSRNQRQLSLNTVTQTFEIPKISRTNLFKIGREETIVHFTRAGSQISELGLAAT